MESTFLDKNHRRIYTQKRNDTIQKSKNYKICVCFSLFCSFRSIWFEITPKKLSKFIVSFPMSNSADWNELTDDYLWNL